MNRRFSKKGIRKLISIEENEYTSLEDIARELTKSGKELIVVDCYRFQEAEGLGGGMVRFSKNNKIKGLQDNFFNAIPDELIYYNNISFIPFDDHFDIFFYNGERNAEKVWKFYGFERTDFDEILEKYPKIENMT